MWFQQHYSETMDLTCEERRKQNIKDNKRILAEIGLDNLVSVLIFNLVLQRKPFAFELFFCCIWKKESQILMHVSLWRTSIQLSWQLRRFFNKWTTLHQPGRWLDTVSDTRYINFHVIFTCWIVTKSLNECQFIKLIIGTLNKHYFNYKGTCIQSHIHTWV